MSFSYLSPNDTTNWGWLIEVGRAVLLLFFFICLIYRVNLDQLLENVKVRNIFLTIFLIMSVCTTIGIVYYHTDYAPRALAHEWSKFDANQRHEYLLQSRDAYWRTVAADPKRESRILEPGTDEYKLMFSRPYGLYLPYPLVIYVGVMLPLVLISFISRRRDFTDLVTELNELSKKTDAAGIAANTGNNSLDILKELYNLYFMYNAAFFRFRASVNRFAWLLAFLGLSALYETAIGYHTLAAAAIVLAIFGGIFLLGGMIFLLPNFYYWNDIVGKYREKVAEAKTDPDAQLAIDELRERKIGELESRLISKESWGTGVTILISVLGIFSPLIKKMLRLE